MDEALSLIDQSLRLTRQRTMYSADEVMDMLLDVRFAITKPAAVEEAPELVPA